KDQLRTDREIVKAHEQICHWKWTRSSSDCLNSQFSHLDVTNIRIPLAGGGGVMTFKGITKFRPASSPSRCISLSVSFAPVILRNREGSATKLHSSQILIIIEPLPARVIEVFDTVTANSMEPSGCRT